MQQIVDLHIHSKYSRATSKNLDLDEIARWAKIKGLTIVSCGDFTHPRWRAELASKLHEDGSGLLSLAGHPDIKFILTTEVACIYRHRDATRRMHHLLLAPSLQAVQNIVAGLEARGCKLGSDGRPILGLSSKDVLKIIKEADPRCELIPAHVWTPWFALFGSKSGYDSVEECFEELSSHIFALETGLSSDPVMNWTLSQNDAYALVSNSDAHSGPKLGREANVFDLPLVTYDALLHALKDKDPNSFLYTIEFFPEEGMYHLDGHRTCDVSMEPAQTKRVHGMCPVCKKPLTVGVLHRVDNLRNRPYGVRPERAIPFKRIIPLPEILAEYYGVSDTSKRVATTYHEMIQRGGNELNILLSMTRDELRLITTDDLAEAIMRMRRDEVTVTAGFDGKYGKISLFSGIASHRPTQSTLL